MFLRKNVGGQVFVLPGTLRYVADGLPVTDNTEFNWIKDGAVAAGAGALTHIGSGAYTYAPTQSETDADICGFLLTAPDDAAVALAGSIRTTGGNPADGARLGLTDLPTGDGASGLQAAGQYYADNGSFQAVADVSSWRGETVSPLVSGRVNAYVGAMGTTVLVGGISAGAVTASSIAAGALNGKGDWLLSSAYTAPNNAGIAAVPTAAQNAAALLATDLGNGRTVAYYLKGGFNKTVRGATTLTVYDTDDATTLAVAALTQDGTLNPIASVDP